MEKLLSGDEWAELFNAIWTSDYLSVDDMVALEGTLNRMRWGIYNV